MYVPFHAIAPNKSKHQQIATIDGSLTIKCIISWFPPVYVELNSFEDSITEIFLLVKNSQMPLPT